MKRPVVQARILVHSIEVKLLSSWIEVGYTGVFSLTSRVSMLLQSAFYSAATVHGGTFHGLDA